MDFTNRPRAASIDCGFDQPTPRYIDLLRTSSTDLAPIRYFTFHDAQWGLFVTKSHAFAGWTVDAGHPIQRPLTIRKILLHAHKTPAIHFRPIKFRFRPMILGPQPYPRPRAGSNSDDDPIASHKIQPRLDGTPFLRTAPHSSPDSCDSPESTTTVNCLTDFARIRPARTLPPPQDLMIHERLVLSIRLQVHRLINRRYTSAFPARPYCTWTPRAAYALCC